MKKRNKRFGIFALVVVLLGMGSFLGYWGMKYFCHPTRLVELPDRNYYEDMTARAVEAKKFAHRHDLSENYCLFVDYSIPSGTPRLFVWSFAKGRVVARTYVMHGPGKGSTAEHPVFSNRFGSNCSALGRFKVTDMHGNRNKRGLRLRGLDIDNQTALARGLMIHRSKWVDTHCWMDYIPLHKGSCLGCVTISTRGMDYIEDLANSEPKRMLLWSYSSKS